MIPGPDYLAWLIYPKPSLLGFCSEFSQIQRSKPDLLFSEFSGFYILFNLQLSRFSFCCQTCLLQRLFIITDYLSFVNNFFNLFFCFFRNICRSLKREDYISKSQTVCQQHFCIIFTIFMLFHIIQISWKDILIPLLQKSWKHFFKHFQLNTLNFILRIFNSYI